MHVFFSGGDSTKFMEIPGCGVYEKHPLEWKLWGGGGAEARVLSVGGMDIIWNYIFAHWSLLISRSTLSCESGNK